MTLSKLDEKIAHHYISLVTDSIKYGENSVLCWFPGAGMTTTINDIFNSKKLLKENLGKLISQLKITYLFGHLIEKKSLTSLIKEAGFANVDELKKQFLNSLASGYEIVCIVGRIDDYPEKEKVTILRFLLQLNSLNPRRIHIIFNTIDKPWFIKTLNKYPEFLVLANRLRIVPVLEGELLNEYITTKADMYGYKISSESYKKIIDTYGGILQLTKEFLRSHGDISTLELKLRIISNSLPKAYRNIFKVIVNGNITKAISDELFDLKQFGVLDLKLFSTHRKVLEINPEKLLLSTLTAGELELWNYCKTHSNQFLSKDTVVNLLRSENYDDITLWAADKAVSRFRKKLAKAGIDPSLFKTLKGKGYIWTD